MYQRSQALYKRLHIPLRSPTRSGRPALPQSSPTMDPAAHRIGTALCVASAIAFGAMAIFGKLAYDAGISLLTLLFIRFSIAAPVLWIAALRRRGALSGASRRTLVAGFALGA